MTDSSHNPRGYFGIACYKPSKMVNVGSIVRAAACFEADYVCTIGKEKYTGKAADVGHSKHVPVFSFESWSQFKTSIPDSEIVLIDYDESAYPIEKFQHPERAVYVVGNEGYGFPDEILEEGHRKVYIDSKFCLNAAVSGAITLHDRRLDNITSTFTEVKGLVDSDGLSRGKLPGNKKGNVT